MIGARVRAATFAFAFAALLGASAARAQTPASVAVTPAMASAVALIECNDGKTRTYQTGVVVGSNGVQSFVVSADLPGPDGKPFAGPEPSDCNAPVVRFADDLATPYPAVRVPNNFSLVPSMFYPLVVDHPVRAVVPFALKAPDDDQAVLLVGFGAAATGSPPALVATREIFRSNIRMGAIRTFGSAATVRAGALLDAATGRLLGVAAPSGPYFRNDGPPINAYALAAQDTIAGLVHEVVPPAAVGVTALEGQARDAARLAVALKRSTPLFLQPSSAGNVRGALAASGFAVIVGATATTTIVAAAYSPSAGPASIAVTRPDGAIDVLPATLVATDAATALAFFSVPKLDVPTPVFGSAPPLGAAVAIPYVVGFLCDAYPPAPGTNECLLAVHVEHVVAPPAGNPTAIGVTAPSTMVVDSGAPVVDPRSGAIVGLSIGGVVAPMAIVALKADAFGVGVKIVVTP